MRICLDHNLVGTDIQLLVILVINQVLLGFIQKRWVIHTKAIVHTSSNALHRSGGAGRADGTCVCDDGGVAESVGRPLQQLNAQRPPGIGYHGEETESQGIGKETQRQTVPVAYSFQDPTWQQGNKVSDAISYKIISSNNLLSLSNVFRV